MLEVDKLKYPDGRSASNLSSRLKILSGSVTDYSSVEATFLAGQSLSRGAGLDAVVLAMGGKTSDVGPGMLATGTSNVVRALRSLPSCLRPGCRLVVVSSIGVGDSKGQAPFFFRVLMATVMSRIFADKNEQEKIVRDSGMPYVLVRPGGLTVAPPTGVVKVITNEAGSISRADLAEFVLKAAFDPDFEYVNKAPCISSVEGTGWIKDRSDKARTGKEELETETGGQ